MISEAVSKVQEDQADLNGVPIGWAKTTLGEILSLEYGKSLIKSSRMEGGKYPVYGSSGSVGFHDDFLVTGSALIVGRKGAAGSVHLCKENFWPIDTTYFVKPSIHLSTEFTFYLLKFCRLYKYESSTAIPGLNRDHAYAEALLLPPFAEQQRIVAKIEELFSELDKGVENLRTAQQQLKVYRQALLKHAFEGKLTTKWREQNPEKLETADSLLIHIKREYETRYEHQVNAWQRAQNIWEESDRTGGKPAKPKKLKVLPPLTGEELAKLSELPVGWSWFRVSHLLAEGLCNGRSVKDRAGGFPVLRLNALTNGKIDLSITKAGDWNEEEAKPYLVEEGDFLVSRGNGSKHLVGRGGFASYKVTHHPHTAFPDTMIRIRLLPESISQNYFGHCWDSHLLRNQIEKSARTTAGIYKINQELIEAFVLPMPCTEEQVLIAQILSEKLSGIDQLEKTITDSLQQAEALRHSILKKAFTGKLVAQNPEDEPASVLLERIKAERDAQQSKSRSRKAKAFT